MNTAARSGGTVRQHYGEAGAASEACQPGRPLGRGDVFAVMLVRARDDDAIQP